LSAIYVDASAVLRVLFGAPGLRAPFSRGTLATSSELIQVEAARALDKARFGGSLDDAEVAVVTRELQKLFARMHLFPVSEEVLELARASFPIRVRVLDALHVATAQVIRAEAADLEYWTHDQDAASAAMVRGLDVHGLPS
jgi:predicted nucleic acid-binding protein